MEKKFENKGMGLNEYRNLIKIAQEGDKLHADMAINDILADVMLYRMNSALAKYRNACTGGAMVDYEDLQQIFLMAVAGAIQEADTEIGNPMLFLLQKGKWAVVDTLRSTYRKVIRQHCDKCGATTRLNEKDNEPICPKCGAHGHDVVHREQFVNSDDGTVLTQVAMETKSIEQMELDKELIDAIKSRLSGRKLEIFELIMDYGYDRDSRKNYIKDIAEKLGVSQANVNLRLRAIRKVITDYFEEETNYDIAEAL